jgi:hypothetical protein
MPLHDATYKHWVGAHRGIWYRRAAIAGKGLRGCLANRWMRHLMVLCWVGALGLTVILFAVGQLLVADSLIVQWSAGLNPALQIFARLLTQWLELPRKSPCGRRKYFVLPLPAGCCRSGSRHRGGISASHYARSLQQCHHCPFVEGGGRMDYLLGKFATVSAQPGDHLAGSAGRPWFVGNLLAPDWHFFWHSRLALFNTALYVLSSMFVLSLLALGLSAISSKEKTSVGIWLAWWIVGYVLVGIAHDTKPWLKHLSFNHNLHEVALAIFRLR